MFQAGEKHTWHGGGGDVWVEMDTCKFRVVSGRHQEGKERFSEHVFSDLLELKTKSVFR